MKKYILAGGECAGKTTTSKALQGLGYHVISESNAALISNEREQKGNIFPWTNFEEHNRRVIELQLERERKIPQSESIIFLDRALTDVYGYYVVFEKEPPKNLLVLINQAHYECVFYFEMIPKELVEKFRERNRRNSHETARTAHEIIKKVYQTTFNIPLINVPFASEEERVKFILEHIHE